MKTFVIAALLAFVAYKSIEPFRHIMILLNADYMPDPFKEQSISKLESCEGVAFQAVKTITGVHDYESASKIIATHTEPLIFKNYIKDPAKLWKRYEAALANKEIPFNIMELNGFGNMWLSGNTLTNHINATIPDILWNIPVDPDQKFAHYASFAAFLDLSHPDFQDETVPTNVFRDTNFVSHFPQDVLGTPIHGAPMAESYSIQYVGRKLWAMAPPHHMERFDALSTPPTLLMKGSEKIYFDMLKKEGAPLYIAAQEEGDMLFFPPFWGHAVVTKAGPNVMLNFRRPSLLRPFIANPFRWLEALVSGIVMNADFNQRRRSPTDVKLQSYAYPYRHGENFDSPCKNRWKEILNR